MDTSKDGGPAFPVVGMDQRGEHQFSAVFNGGMSLRDYFAGQALAGMTAGITRFRDDAPEIIINRPNDIAQLAYLYADVMISERSK